MSRRKRRGREVELFNFSFLDILACVIGLLIFILSIVATSSQDSRSSRTASEVASAEKSLQRAKTVAQLSADRREQSEQILSRQSQNFRDPAAAAEAVRAETKLISAETVGIEEETEANLALASTAREELRRLNAQLDPNPSTVAAQNRIRDLGQQSAAIADQTLRINRQAAARVQHIEYYVPHFREVQRRTLWVEIVGDRVFCLESDNYVRTTIDEESTSFTRNQNAVGVRVADLVDGHAKIPVEIAASAPRDTVLEIALHSDGGNAFRTLRQWAWSKGYSVNWTPQNDTPIVLVKSGHAFEQ